MPELAGKKLALAFSPASDADDEVLNSYISSSDPDTDEITLNDFPHSVPGYLINLSASLVVDGSVVVSHASVGQMGQQLSESIGLWSPAFA